MSRYPNTYNGQALGYVALASQKNAMSLYLMGVYGDPAREQALKEAYVRAGKRLDMGKSCLRFRKVEDLELGVLGELIESVSVEDYLRVYEAVRAKTAAGRKEAAKAKSAGGKMDEVGPSTRSATTKKKAAEKPAKVGSVSKARAAVTGRRRRVTAPGVRHEPVTATRSDRDGRKGASRGHGDEEVAANQRPRGCDPVSGAVAAPRSRAKADAQGAAKSAATKTPMTVRAATGRGKAKGDAQDVARSVAQEALGDGASSRSSQKGRSRWAGRRQVGSDKTPVTERAAAARSSQ